MFDDDDINEGKTVLYRYDSAERLEERERAGIKSPASPQAMGMQLDLSFAADKQRKDAKSSSEDEDEAIPIQEMCITVVFDLPDGSQGESIFKLGQTVEVLKSYVESEYGMPMAEQKMYIEERAMMNPLSLLDFPEAKGVDEIFIRVTGPLPTESKK